MWLKILDSNFIFKVANKCLNVRRGIRSVLSLLLSSYETLVSVKRNLGRKNIEENLDFVENSNFIRGTAEHVFANVPL